LKVKVYVRPAGVATVRIIEWPGLTARLICHAPVRADLGNHARPAAVMAPPIGFYENFSREILS
jgi:hypothetical protein